MRCLKIDLRHCEVAILFDNALCAFVKRINCLISPPGNFISVLVKQSTIIVKAMCDLVPYDRSDT